MHITYIIQQNILRIRATRVQNPPPSPARATILKSNQSVPQSTSIAYSAVFPSASIKSQYSS
jgi:hypothetical protein